MYYGNVTPDVPRPGPRDIGHGYFKYRQWPDGLILVTKAPQPGIFGYWLPGTSGGQLEGQLLKPGTAIWHQITKEIGPHPAQRPMGAGAGPGPSRGYSGAYGRRFVDTVTDIASGFTPDPRGDAGAMVATSVEAIPGIRAAVANAVTPSTFEGLSRRLGRLKGDLARTRDPRKRAILNEQIAAVEFKLANLRGMMTGVGTVEPSQAPLPWWPFAIGGAMLVVGGALAVRSRR